jgi:dipeptidyl-peptidase-3
VLERNSKFKSAPYSGFVNPVLVLVKDPQGNITDVKVTQPKTFSEQMLNYAKEYTTLPDVN